MARPAPRLDGAVHRDLAHILAHWSDYFRVLSSEGFALLVILEALRTRANKSEQLHFAHLAADLGVSANTLRRWLTKLRQAGLLSTRFVPGTHSMEAFFRISLQPPGNGHRKKALPNNNKKLRNNRKSVKARPRRK